MPAASAASCTFDLIDTPACDSKAAARMLLRYASVALACVVSLPAPARPHLIPCRHDGDASRLTDALRRIRGSVDPCGESAAVRGVLDRLERCAGTSYEVCISSAANRNLFEQGRITWNPELRSELEPTCDGEIGTPVTRDPTASLLHELVHALEECEGPSPGAHELEAVRIENIYRRAAGLCQRTGYGDEPLPAAWVVTCRRGDCTCSAPTPTSPGREARQSPGEGQAADAAPTSRDAGTEPAR